MTPIWSGVEDGQGCGLDGHQSWGNLVAGTACPRRWLVSADVFSYIYTFFHHFLTAWREKRRQDGRDHVSQEPGLCLWTRGCREVMFSTKERQGSNLNHA